MKVCRKCGYPLSLNLTGYYQDKYCNTCRNVIFVLRCCDEGIWNAIDELEERIGIRFSRKERGRLIHVLSMKKIDKISNGRFFSKPRQPILGAWLFP